MQAVHQDQASYVKIQAQGDLKKIFSGAPPSNPLWERDISVSVSALRSTDKSPKNPLKFEEIFF